MSKQRPGTNGIPPQRSVLGPLLLKIFVSNMDSSTECTLSKFADNTKYCDLVDALERKHWSRGTWTGLKGRPKSTSWSSKRASARCYTLVRHKHRLSMEQASSLKKRDLRVLVDEKSSTWASNVYLQPRRPTVPWTASREVWPARWRKWFYLSAFLRFHLEYCI